MHDWQSLAHVRWECKYHVVIIPKYRRKVFYGHLRRQIGRILRSYASNGVWSCWRARRRWITSTCA